MTMLNAHAKSRGPEAAPPVQSLTMNDDNVRRMSCLDCLIFAANGESPEDDTRAEQIAHAFGRWFYDGYVIAVGDDKFDITFSTAPCELCDSTLFGSRHELWAIPRPNPVNDPAS